MIKKSLLYFIAIVAFIGSCNTAPSATGRDGIKFKTPVEYNDYIISRQLKIVGLINQFATASNVNIDSANAVLQRSSVMAGEYLADVNGLTSYNGETTFKNAAVNSFAFYKRIFEQEYKELLAINAKGDGVDENDRERAIAITQAISAEEAELDKRFINAQKDFAQKNKLELDGSEATQKRLQEAQD
jgi:hypothetical protein